MVLLFRPARYPAQRPRARRGLWGVCAVLLLACLAGSSPLWAQAGGPPAPASPPEDQAALQKLQAAIRAYEHGGYLSAAEQLNAILYPLKLTDRRDIVIAKAWLGMSLYILGRKIEAEQEFRGVFRLQPGWRPDPLKVPPELVTFIERLRPPPERPTALPGLGEELKVGELPTGLPPRISRREGGHPLWLAFLPFGVDQLMRPERGLGLALAVSQGALLGANLGTYAWLTAAAQGEPPTSSEYEQLVAIKALNLASFGLFSTVYVLSVGEALLREESPRPLSLHLSIGPTWLGLQGTF